MKRKKGRQAPVVESLEPRILLSADLPGLDIPDLDPNDPLDADVESTLAQALEAFEAETARAEAAAAQTESDVESVEEPELLLPSSELPDDVPRELIIVDPSVPNYERLLADVSAVGGEGTRLNVVMLDPQRSGIDQISEILASRSGLGAIHLISHGSDASIQIGGDTLDLALLQTDPEAIRGWGGALSEEGDILIYGCNVAETEAGQMLIDTLAEMTRADVAASDDLTGHGSLGGDWELEYRAGEIETTVAVSAKTQSTYDNVLALTPDGGNHLFNESTTDVQKNVDIGLFDDDSYVAVWDSLNDGSGEGIYLRILNADGTEKVTETLVNQTTTNVQNDPSVAVSSNGDFVVSWTSTQGGGMDVYARVYDSNGIAQTDEFLVNTGYTTGEQWNSVVAIDDSGNFVVVWQGEGTGDATGIYAQRYDNLGNTVGGVTLANDTVTAADQIDPAVAMNGSGAFVITWTDPSAGDTRIAAQQFTAGGIGQGEFVVHATADGGQGELSSAVAIDDSGKFVVTWAQANADGSGYGIEMQRFDTDRTRLEADDVQVNTTTSVDQIEPAIAMRGDGSFVVSWTSLDQDGDAKGVILQQFNADGTKNGGEEVANSYTISDQHVSQVTMNDAGKVIVAWEGQGSSDTLGVWAQRYDGPPGVNDAPVNSVPGGQATPQGTDLVFSSGEGNAITVSDPDAGSSEIEVTLSVDNGTLTVPVLHETQALTTANATETSTQEHGDIAYAPDGSYVVVWEGSDVDSNGVYMQRFDAVGNPIGGETPVNVTTANGQVDPAIAMDASGSFVVVWASYGQDKNNTWGVYGQRFDATGNPIGGEFLVNATTAGSQYAPDIAMEDNGDFAVAWVGNGTGDTDGIFVQRFDASANEIGGQTLVNTTTTGEQANARITMDATGNFVVSWEDSNVAVRAQMFDATGATQGSEIVVANDPAENEQDASVAIRADGSFAVVWTQGTGPAPGTYLQLYDNAGNATGGAIQVTSDKQSYPDVIATADGGFAVSWTAGTDVMLQRLDSVGGLLGEPVVVGTAANLGGSSLAVNASGDVGIVFDGTDSSFGGVFVKQFGAPDIAFAAGDGTDDATVTLRGTVAGINAALDALVYTPGSGFNGYDTLTITTDDLGNTGSGGALTDVDTVSIAVGNPDAPVIDLDADDSSGQSGTDFAATWSEDSGPVAIVDADATLIDSDENLTQVTATITNLLDGAAESLSANAGATGLSVNYDSGTGVLTILGAGTAAQYEQVLRTVTYDNSSDNPDTTARVITVTATDAISGGNTATTTLTIDAVNDAPVNTVPGAQTTDQDTDLVFSSGNGNAITVSDVDADTVEVTLTATNGTVTVDLGSAAGDETLINAPSTDMQEQPDIAVATDGSYVVTWAAENQDGDGWGVYAQRFDASGTALTGELLVNGSTTGNQTNPSVAVADNGKFVVTWETDHLGTGYTNIYGQLFDGTGTEIGNEFRVDQIAGGDLVNASVAMDADGDFVIAFESHVAFDGDGWGIYARSYDNTGAPQAGQFQVNTSTAGNQAAPTVAMDDLGNYVIAWGDISDTSMRFQLYDNADNEVGDETVVAGYGFNASVSMNSTGEFVVAWQGADSDSWGVHARQYDATGAAAAPEFQVNTYETIDQVTPDVAINASSEFVVLWESYAQDAAGTYGIYGQRFDAAGNTMDGEFLVNATTAGSQRAPATSLDDSGRLLVVWDGNGPGDADGIYLKRYGLPVAFTAGDGTTDSTMTFRGSVADVNAALEGLTFTPTASYSGSASVQIQVSDLGGTGTGGTLTDTDMIDITVGTPLSNTAPTDLSSGIELNTDGGDDAYLVTGSGGSLLGGLSEFSVEVQFSVDSINTENTLVSYATAAQNNGFMMTLVNDGTVVVLLNGTPAVVLNGMDYTELMDGGIHTLGFSWDSVNGDWAAYADGQLVESGTGFRTGQTLVGNGADGTLVLGQEQDTLDGGYDPAQAMHGTLYDVRLWDQARSSAEIALNHQQKFDSGSLPSGLLANWQMDGFNGSNEVVDVVSGNNLSVGHAPEAGFVASTPVGDLHVDENAANGTSVGFVVPSVESPPDDLVSDGSFTEAGSASGNPTYYADGSGLGSVLGGWTVTNESVDYLGNIDPPPLGGNAIDLGGDWPGTIAQTLATVAGQQYQVVFALTGNFSGGAEAVKDVRVSAAGQSADFSAVEEAGWDWVNDAQWNQRSFTFTADSTNTDLSFQSLNTDTWGAIIANVEVLPVPSAVQTILDGDASLSYDAATGKFYKTVTAINSWAGANTTAQASSLNGVGGNLVSIHSSYENDLVQALAQAAGGDIWIGATDQTAEGEFHWQDNDGDGSKFWTGGGAGSALGYANWFSGTPRTPGTGEDYVTMDSDTGTWNDFGEGMSRRFVIEWDASEVLGSHTFSLTDDADGRFAVDSSTGEITVADGSLLDYEADTSHNVTVQVTNADGNSYSEVMTIAVGDVNDNVSPVITSNGGADTASVSIPENTVTVTTVTATDGDGDQIEYTITGGADAALFDIDRNTGALTFLAAPDFEAPADSNGDNVYEVEVTADDQISTSDTQTISVTVTTVNDAPTFIETEGVTATDVGNIGDYGQAITVQSDGKVLIAGYSSSDLAITRYNTDGTLDTSFGGGDDIVKTDIGGSLDYAYDVVVQDDGRILIAGASYVGGNYDFLLVCYNADGSLDTSFGGGDGIVTTDIAGVNERAYSLSVQDDGKIVLAGYQDNGGQDIVLVRYNSDGSLDTGFGGGDGIVTTDIGGNQAWAYDVTIQNDGRILVTGSSDNGTDQDVVLLRYNSDGSLDTGFGGGDGIQITAISADDVGYGVTLQTDGKILVTGYSGSGGSDFLVLRYNGDGTLDTGFGGGDGIVTTDMGGGDYARDVVVLDDSRIVVGGYSTSPSKFAVAVYNSDGTLDTGFGGGDGKVITSIDPTNSSSDFGYSMTVQDDGKILVGGASYVGTTGYDFSVARYNADGMLDTDFGQFMSLNNRVTYIEGGAAVVLDADVDVSDDELDALNGGLGNYSGASLALVRDTGANTEDQFSFNGGNGITLVGSNLVKNGQVIASFDVTTTSGELVISFTDANGETPTSADVDNILNQITYSNTSSSPPSSVQVNWTFDDGNTGSQGSGGSLGVSGSTVVSITAVNSAPTGLPSIIGVSTEDQTLTANTSAISDDDGLGTFSYQWKRDGVDISGATGGNYLLGDDDVGKNITVEVSYTDGGGASESLTSAAVGPIGNINDAPVVTVDPAPVLFLTVPIDVDPALTVTDVDSATLTSAQVWFGDGFQKGHDRLLFIDQLGITGSYDNNSGTLTLTGTASVADYQTALRSVQYNDVNPTPAEGIIYVHMSVSDGTDTSNVGTRVVEVVDNMPPRAGDDVATVAEGASTVIDLAGNDTDAEDKLDLTSIVITSGPANGSILVHAGGTVTYTHDGSESASDTFSYTIKDLDGNVSSEAPVSITVTAVNDGAVVGLNTGLTVAEGSTGTVITGLMLNEGDPDDDGAGLTYTVTSVTTNGTLKLSGTALGLNDTFTQADIDAGNLTYDHDSSETVSDGFSFSLADGGEDGAVPVSDTFSITVTPVNGAPADLIVGTSTDGGLGLNVDGGNDAYLLAADGDAIFGGLTATTMEIQFSSTILPVDGGDADFVTYGAATQSSNNIWFGTWRNDAGAGHQLGLGVDGAYVYATGYDANALFDGEQHTVSVTWEAGNYEFFVDGVSVGSGTGFKSSHTVPGGGELVIGMEQDAIGGGFQSDQVLQATVYDVRIFDDARTPAEVLAGAGQTVAPTEGGLVANWTFNDLSTSGVVIDTVSGNDLTVMHASGAGFVGSVPSLSLTVAENAPLLAVVGSVATIDPDTGDTFTYALLDDAGGRFSIDSATGEIKVANPSLLDYESSTSHDITVQTTDSGGLTHSEVFGITVEDANDAPTGQDKTITTLEDQVYTFTLSDFGYADEDGDPVALVKVLPVHDADYIRLDGVILPNSAIENVSIADINAGKLTFHPPADTVAIADILYFQVNDGTADSIAQTISANVTPVNDAPVLTAGSLNNLTVNEDSGLTSLGLGGVTYGPGGGADEAGQTLTYEVSVIPSPVAGDIFLADGTTRVTTGTYTLAEIQGMQFRPADDWNGSTAFEFRVRDSGGAANGGTDEISQFISITVDPVNDAPAVDLNGSNDAGTGFAATFNEGAGAVAIADVDATVSDLDSVSYDGLSISIFGISDGSSEKFTVGGHVFSSGVGDVVTRTVGATAFELDFDGTGFNIARDGGGVVPDVDLEALIRGISYENTSADPTAGDRTIEFVAVDDQGLAGSAAQSTVTVVPDNDAPTLGFGEGNKTFAEGTGRVVIDASITLTDIDSADFDGGALTVSLTTNGSAEDRLGLQNEGTGVGQVGVLGTDVTYNFGAGAVVIGTVSGGTSGSDPLLITFNANSTLAAVEQVAGTVSFMAIGNDPSGATRTVEFVVTDGDGGTSAAISKDISVTPVNDAPSFATTNSTPTFTENGGPVGLFSATSVDLIEAGDLADTLQLTVDGIVDGSNEVLVIDGQAIELTHLNSETTAANGYDVSVSVSGSTATVVITKTGGFSATDAEALVDGLAYNNTSENPQGAARTATLTSIQDDGGTTNGGYDSSGIGITSLVTIDALNDDPTNTGSLPTDVTVTEDTSSFIDLSSVVFSDVDAGNQLLTVTLTTGTGGRLWASSDFDVIVSGSGTGFLQLQGGVADLNNFFSAASRFSYLHGTAHTNGDNADTIQIQVSDGGNTGSGGGGWIDFGTVNVDISAVNDTPLNTVPVAQTTAEDTPLVFSTGNGNAISINDVDAGGGDVAVRLVTTNGTVSLSGIAGLSFTTGDGSDDADMLFMGTVAEINAALEGLIFTPTADFDGAASIQIVINDSGNTGSGGAKEDSDTIAITVTPEDDAPTIGGVDTGSVTEDVDPDADGLLETSGTLTISDPDAGESSFQAGTIVGTYGDLTIDAAGNWSYAADNTQTAIQQLDVTETLTDTLTVTSFDGTTHDITITINGAEDAPVITADISGTVIEDTTLTVTGAMGITDVDASDNPISFPDEASTPGDNGYGSFELTGGTWTYTLSNGNATVQGLGAGDSLTDTHTFTATDGSTRTVTVTIDGKEDAPLLVTNNPLSVPEEGSRIITSAYLAASDSDSTAAEITYTLTSLPGGTGTVRLGGSTLGLGDTFTQDDIDNNQLSFSMGDDASVTDFKFTISDGTTTSAEYTFSCNGTAVNDAPVNTVPGTQTVLEETATAIAGISVVDIDAGGADITTRLQVSAGTLDVTLSGTASISAGSNGSGDLTIQGTVADINATLASLIYTGATDVTGIAADTLTVTTDDGGNTGSGGVLTDTDTVQINITNVNDAAQFGGVDTGSVTEDIDPDTDGLLETGGTLTVTDADAGESSFQAGSIVGTYGSLTIDAAGVWTFSADNAQGAIQQLDVSETLTDTLTVTSFDGTTHDITITINGAEDASVVSGTTSGAVTEGNVGDGAVTATGSISISDVDASDTPAFNDVASTTGDNAYGSFELTGGTWTYTLDQSAVQGLDADDVVNDTITYTATDGSTQQITVSITGTDDNSVITGTATGAVTEGNVGDAPVTATGSIAIGDVDADDSPVFNDVASTIGDSAYGSFELTGGTWTYTLNQTAVQDLDAGDLVVDTITYTATDGSTQQITVSITGTDDSSVITGTATGAVTEGNVGDAPVTATGSIAISDVDADDSPTFNDVVSTVGDNAYGSFELTGGAWTYTLNQAAVQDLDAGDSVNDTITYTATDGSTQQITVSITGTDDTSVITGTATGAVTEGNVGDAPVTATGSIAISDVDADDSPSFADVASTLGDNAYGSFELTGGTWTYTLDQSAVQHLDAGESVIDIHTFVASDGASQTVTITINGTEDAPTLDVAISDQSATEDNPFSFTFVANTFGDLDASDTLTYTATLADDSPLPAWLTFDEATRTFSGTPTNADVGTLSVKVVADDGSSTVTDIFDILVGNTNDAPVFGGTNTGAVTEDVDPDADLLLEVSGALTISDPDAGESSFQAGTVVGTYGDMTLDSAGNWSYAADNTQLAIQQLDVSETLTDTLTVTSFDGTTHDITITINGAEDAPVISGTTTGSVTEGNVGDAPVTATGSILIADVDADDSPAFNDVASTVGDNAYGSFQLTAGTWTYTLDQSAVQDLDAGDLVTDTITYTATDGSTQAITVSITGTDDSSVITGTATGEVTEGNVGDAPVTATGSILIADVDADDSPVFNDVASTVGDNAYGSFTLTAGTWTYTLDQSAVQDLDAGDVVNDTITFTATDGSTQQITVSITGTDDTSVITGTTTGAVTEGNVGDAPVTATGSIGISDIDADDSPAFNDVASTVGDNGYGSFQLVSGTWTYTLDQSAVQDLDAGDVVNDTITYTATDGSTQQITVGITGTDDNSVITGTTTGAVIEGNVGDAPVTATGSISISDVDADDSPVFNDVASTVGDNAYGSFTLTAGTWTYTLDQSAVQDLDAGDVVNDTITYTATDGSTQQVTVSISGTDDNSVITGTTTGAVIEGNVGDTPVTATGSISISDVDADDSPVFNDVASTVGDNAYGSFTLTAGTWTYTLDQSAVQDLDAGDVVNDTITLTATDGSTQQITVNITGTDDNSVITGTTTGAVIEGNIGDAPVTATGSISISDIDADDSPVFNDVVSMVGDNTYGSFTLTAGTWTYTLDQSSVQDLDAGDVVTDTITYTATDGSTQQITVGITGTDDTSVITGTTTGAVTEGNVGDAPVTATGSIGISDIDADDSPAFNDVASTVGDNGYGSFQLVSGTWTYTLDQSAVQDLDAGDVVNDTITFTATDGSTQSVTVSITGTDDTSVITGTTTGAATEGNVGDAPVTATGSISIADVDADDSPAFNDVASTVGDNAYGSFTLTAGTWTYTLDQSSVQDLDAGDVVNDTITFTATDGSTQQVTVSITGTDDNSIITGTTTGAVTEGNVGDAAVMASGSISISDVDASDNPVFNDVASTAGDNGYGSFALAGGTWTYTLDQSAVQHLDALELVTDTITFTATDGSIQAVAITISGTEDVPVIGGVSTGVVTEDIDPNADAMLQTAGTLTINDADTGESNFLAGSASGSYGALIIDETGNWSYEADNTQASIQQMDAGESVDDTLTVTTADGTSHVVTITINGAEDAAVLGGTTSGSVGEDGTLTASGTLTISDADSSDNPVSFPDEAGTLGDNGYGHFQLSGGQWIYTLNNEHEAVQTLEEGISLTDSHTFTASDGSTRMVSIEISGVDEPMIPSAESDPEPLERPSFETEQVAEEEPVEEQAEEVSESASELEAGRTDPSTADPVVEEWPAVVSGPQEPLPLEPDEILLSILTDARPNDRPAVNSSAPSVDKPTVETAQTFLQELKSFWKDDSTASSIELSEVRLSQDFWDGLDKMGSDMDESIAEEERKAALSTEAAAGVGISMTAGFISWALRAGSMAASFLTSMPMWRTFDPMPILGEDNKKRQASVAREHDDLSEDEETEKSVDDLFER